MSCADQFPGGMCHSGAEGEGRFASTTARKGALRRGASPDELNGVRWSGWVDMPRHEPDPLPFQRVTSLNADVLEHELRDHPNAEFRTMVVNMARHGVSLGADGYVATGPRLQPNLKSADLYPDHIRKWIGKEVTAGRLAGPFTSMPHPKLQCWGVGVIPKGGSDLADPEAKARVITHLSQESDGLPSMNATVDPASAKVHYTRVVDAIDMIEEFTASGGDPHIALVDMKAAYRNLQIRQEDLALVGIRFPNKETGEDEFYYDRCVGFGGRASPSRFDALASAVQWIAERRAAEQGVRCKYQHYLDDFLGGGYDADHTAAALRVLLQLFVDLDIPAEPSKTQPTTKRAVYLGIQFDLQEQTVSMPIDKVTRWSAELAAIAAGAASTPKKLASMAGKLGFAMVCMPAMRPRMAPFYAASAPALRDGRGRSPLYPNGALKEAAADFATVLRARPATMFAAFSASPEAANLQFSVDAAGFEGLGGFSLDRDGRAVRYHSQWPDGFSQGDPGVSSGLQEMLTVATLVHQHETDGDHLNFWTDSAVCVDAIARGSSATPPLNRTLDFLLFTCASRSLTVTVAWHFRDTSPSATAADALSRGRHEEASVLLPAIAAGSIQTLRCSDCPAFEIKPNSSTMRR